MKLTKNQKIILIVALGAFLLLGFKPPTGSVVPLSIVQLSASPVLVTVTVKDSTTQQPLSGVTVVEYNGGTVYASGVTDSFGSAQMWGAYEVPITFKTFFSGYDSNSVNQIFYVTGGASVTIQITKMVGGGGGTTVYASIYCVDNQLRRVANVLVSSSLATISTDDNGLVKVPVTQGSNLMSFSSVNGPRALVSSVWVAVPFNNYANTVNIQSDSDWVAYVQQGTLAPGTPPSQQFNWGDIWGLLTMNYIAGIPNWMLIAGTFALYFLLRAVES